MHSLREDGLCPIRDRMYMCGRGRKSSAGGALFLMIMREPTDAYKKYVQYYVKMLFIDSRNAIIEGREAA